MKALIAMSGGVDSSVCAYLAKKAGYECIGVTMKLCQKDIDSTDADDAARVCAKLGIEHIVLDCTNEFREIVIDDFVKNYEDGATPNPCIVCNKHIKFGLLFDKADALGCDVLVTGHYARTDASRGNALCKAKDIAKDQSYVLYPIDRKRLPFVYFPLGDYTKQEVREIAAEQGFVTARKSDSQDICFVPDGDYASVIENITGKNYPKGEFTDESGAVLGEHNGIIRYTPGQRKGLGIAFGKPMYVKSKDIGTNRVILSDNESLFSKELYAKEFNLLTDVSSDSIRAKAKVRYNQREQDATVHFVSDNRVRIVFDEPQRAIARGQSVVVYDGDVVIGGGIIE